MDTPSLPFDTRLAAHKRIATTIQETKTRILRLYRERGPEGYTAEELAEVCACDKDHTSPRISELLSEELLRDTGRRRRTRSGASAAVLVHFEHFEETRG